MKETKNFEEAFKDCNLDVRKYGSIFPKTLIGAKIVDLRYGPDHDGDPTLYYIKLDNGISIGIAICNDEDYGKVEVEELDRTKRDYLDHFIRFQFHDWPEDWKKIMEECEEDGKG